MAFTQQDVERLEAAVASGVLTVSYDGPPRRSVTYQNLAGLIQALALVKREVNGATSYRLARTSKGIKGGGTGSGGTDWSNNE